ncbi:MAG: SLC13 family permease, partial [Betaproteobacteria bacterium]|nr:SLC13 family permease [Betaproteobacteria bacterium]
MPALPDTHALAVMALVVFALVLFTRERIPLETSCLAVMVILVVGFQIFPYESGGEPLRAVQFFSGFGHEALVAICALMVLGAGLEATGSLRPVAAVLARLWQSSPVLSLLLTLVVAAILSAFLNNTPIVVMLLPILVGTALRSGVSPSGVLLPMGLATLLGGMATTIGTSTNLLVVSVASDLGLKPFGLFSFTWMVAVASVPGLIYLWLVAPRLLPERKPPLEDTAPRVFDAWLHIGEDSSANGKTVAEVRKQSSGKLRLVALERGDGMQVSRLPTAVIRAGDRLRVSGTAEELKDYEKQLGGTLHNIDDLEHRVDDDHPLLAEDQQIAEVVVTEQSSLNLRTLSQLRFAERYSVVILGMQRPPGRATGSVISEEILRSGDVLLVQGAADRIAELKGEAQLLVLDASMDLPKTNRAGVA